MLAALGVIGTIAVAGAWGVHTLILRGRPNPDGSLRALEAAIADVEAGRRTTPLIGEPMAGGDVTVTFLARRVGGQVPRVVSDVTGWGEHIDGTFDFAAGAMTRVGKSDWYSLQTTVAPRARIEYQIAYATTDYRLDPYNPRRSAGPAFGGAAASEFVTPGYVPPQEFEDPRPAPRGTVSEAALEGPCKTMVYTPAGHSRTSGFLVAVFLDLRTDPISRVLDWLIARGDIPPIAAAFVGPRSYGDESCSGVSLADFVTGRLPAWLRSRHGADGRADSHAILAISYGAKDALEIALRNPGAFRRLGLLIPGRRINRTDIAGIAGYRDPRLQVAILAGRYDHANLPTARGLRQALADAGHTVNYMEVSEGHSASTWRNHLRGVLVSLFGIPSATATAER
jgi:enterochelin esterase-like enzyme